MNRGRHPDPARLSQSTRAKLLVLLPLTMALLVAATGFFTMSMTRRIDVLHGTVGAAADAAIGQVGVQLALISFIAATLGFGIAVGVTAPLREVADKLEAIASGDLRAALDIRSTSELDSLGGAFNDAIGAINRYVFQSMTGAVITLNADGIVTGSSPAAEVILGYHEDELVGRRFSEVFTPCRVRLQPDPTTDGDRAALAAVDRAIARREAVSVEEVPIAAKDGRPIRIGINVSYLRRGDRPAGDRRGTIDATDEAIGVMIALKDLTEIRRLRDRLQQADQLVSLGTLTAGVAHELRNPLASMQGLAELLKRDLGEDDSRRQYLDTMLDAIGRLNRLVEDLLLFSSPSSAVQEEVDLHALVQETVMFVRLGTGDRAVVLTLVGEDESARGLIVSGSGERLGQALSNILLNAVQATPDGGAVTVRTAGSPSQAVITVHNTGSYIAPDRMKQLFVPFFTTKPTGTGLGLAISRQIVTAHGGRLEVESDRVAGTTFQIELPVARRVAAGAAQPAADGAPRIHLPLPTAHTSG